MTQQPPLPFTGDFENITDLTRLLTDRTSMGTDGGEDDTQSSATAAIIALAEAEHARRARLRAVETINPGDRL